jgi:hypothetical protein
MKQGFVNWNRTVAWSMVLAVLMVISAGQAPAVEPKGDLKPNEVKALVASAKTPADHMKLARHYTAMAAKHEAEAQEHEALAVESRGTLSWVPPNTQWRRTPPNTASSSRSIAATPRKK